MRQRWRLALVLTGFESSTPAALQWHSVLLLFAAGGCICSRSEPRRALTFDAFCLLLHVLHTAG